MHRYLAIGAPEREGREAEQGQRGAIAAVVAQQQAILQFEREKLFYLPVLLVDNINILDLEQSTSAGRSRFDSREDRVAVTAVVIFGNTESRENVFALTRYAVKAAGRYCCWAGGQLVNAGIQKMVLWQRP